MEIKSSADDSISSSLHHTWVLAKFDEKMTSTPPGSYLQCDQFGADPTANWQIRLYPNGSTAGDPGKVAVYLCLQGPADVNVVKRVVFKLSYLDPSGSETYGFFQRKNFIKPAGAAENSWGFWTSHANLLQYGVMRPDGSTVISCHIQELEETVDEAEVADQSDRYKEVLPSLAKLYRSEQLADCHLKAEGIAFPAHKVWLSIQSDFFLTSFTSKLNESKPAEMEISDASADAVGAMLRFMYTREEPTGQHLLVELLQLADRFLLADLKDVCQRRLNDLDIGNVLNRYSLAHLVVADELRLNCSRFIRLNWAQLVVHPSWKDFCRQQPHFHSALLHDIMGGMARPQVNSQTNTA